MDPLTAIAASGLRARMESLELLANNVANAATGGYKADREFYNLYASEDVFSTMPLIERPWIDLAQGEIRHTGNSLDLALSGKGFFSVNGPSGPLYTRNGSFRVDAGGKLVSAEGHAVRAIGNRTIVLESARPVDISSDGTVTQDGAAAGRLEIVDFKETAGLSKQGSNYFRADVPATPANASVGQGKLEGSNTGSAEAAVRLVSVMRQYEMLQKAIALGGEMNRAAVEQVARVSQ